jgi:hypothetical protein
MKKIYLLTLTTLAYASAFTQSTVIGTTTYDVQTNNATKNHVIAYDDGAISAAWTGSTDATTAFTDRGTFYNHYDGSDWGSYPTARVESVRTGFGELIHVDGSELALAHFFTGSAYNMQFFGNDGIGGSTWTEATGSDDVSGLWGFADCPAGTDDIYIVTANTNPPTGLNFSRSDDGGDSWTVLNYALPGLTSSEGFPSLANAAETYLIKANGTDVYVLFGLVNSDLVLLHSAENGDEGTWETITVLDFPYDAFTGLEQTDIDGDGNTDTIGTTDGYHELLITDDGTVHVFSGYMRLYSDGFGFYSLNTRASGIWHWSSGMAGAELIDTEIDWSGDGNPYGGIGAVTTNYRSAAISSCPSASWDPATGNLYLMYTMKVEYTDIYDDPTNLAAESFRDIFGIYSTDGGATWSSPKNLTNTAESGEENFYISAADRVVDGNVHLVWQQDDQPGHFNEGDIVHTNNIRHQAFTETDFADETVACDATAGPAGLYADAITALGATLHWNAVDEADKFVVSLFTADFSFQKKREALTNMLEITSALEPETTYGFRVKTVCYDEGNISPYGDIYYFTTGPLKQAEFFEQIFSVYPNPATDQITIALPDADAAVVLYNISGEKTGVTFVYTGTTSVSADVSKLPAGNYLVKIISGNKQLHSILTIE